MQYRFRFLRRLPWTRTSIYGIINITLEPLGLGITIMTARTDASDRDAKREALQQGGGLNSRPDAVQDDLFRNNEFFDPRDVVQVKYEMLRRAQFEGLPVSQAAEHFGFSRPAYYHALETFQAHGLPGLIRKRPGPKRAHKLSEEIVDYLERLRAEDAELSVPVLAEKVRQRFRVVVHPRSVERALQRRRKKGR
jgi:transposase